MGLNAGNIYIGIKGDADPLERALRAAKRTATTAGRTIEGSFNRVASGLNRVSSAAISVRGALTTIVAGAVTTKVLGIADNYTLLESRLSLVTGSTEELDRVQGKLFETSQRTRQSYESTATLYTKVSRATRELGTTEQERLAITENLNKAFIVSGASQEAAGNATLQLTQALQGGVVRAEEYNSIMENTPRVLEAVAEGLGVTMGELRKEMLEGKLSAERFLAGFKAGSAGIIEEFDKMEATVGQAGTYFANVFNSIINDSNKSAEGTKSIAGEIISLADTIDANREDILSIFTSGIELATSLFETVINITKSFEGWAAVGSGKLDFFEFATMDAKELAEWLEKDRLGVVSIDKQIEELYKKRQKIKYTIHGGGILERDAIDAEIKALEDQKDTIIHVGKVIKEDYQDAWVDAGKTATRVTKTVNKSTKDQVAYIGLAQGKIKHMTDDAAKALVTTGDNARQTLENLNIDLDLDGFFDDLDEIAFETDETTNFMQERWTNAWDSIQDKVSDFIREWDFSMDSILDIFKDMLADMAAAILMSGIKDMFASLFNLGSSLPGIGGFLGGLGNLVAGSGGAPQIGIGDLLGTAASQVGSWATETLGLPSVSTLLGFGGGPAPLAAPPMIPAPTLAGGGSAASSGGLSNLLGGLNIGSGIFGGVALGVIGGVLNNLFGDNVTPEDLFNDAQITPDILGLSGVKGTLTEINDVIEATIPLASGFEEVAYDAQSGVLLLVETGGRLTGVAGDMSGAINDVAVRFDKSTGKWHDFHSNLDGMIDKLTTLGPATDAELTRLAEQIAASEGLSFASEALIDAYHATIGTIETQTQATLDQALANNLLTESQSQMLMQTVVGAANMSAAADALRGAFNFDHTGAMTASRIVSTDMYIDAIAQAGETPVAADPWREKIDGQFHAGGTIPYDGTFYLKKGEEVIAPQESKNSDLTRQIDRLIAAIKNQKSEIKVVIDGLEARIDKVITAQAKGGTLGIRTTF